MLSSSGAGLGGNISASLAKDIANHKGHKVKVIDRIHAAMIVLSFYFILFVLAMLPYLSTSCRELFSIFTNWKDNSTFFTWVKIFIIIFISAPLGIFVIGPLGNKLGRMSIWYALEIFIITTGTSITMLVLAMAKH